MQGEEHGAGTVAGKEIGKRQGEARSMRQGQWQAMTLERGRERRGAWGRDSGRQWHWKEAGRGEEHGQGQWQAMTLERGRERRGAWGRDSGRQWHWKEAGKDWAGASLLPHNSHFERASTHTHPAGWVETHLDSVFNIAGSILGVPKSITAVLSGVDAWAVVNASGQASVTVTVAVKICMRVLCLPSCACAASVHVRARARVRLCVCVRACVRACVRVCVRACERARALFVYACTLV
eukprot:364603-Chlamydomonas_euryale.AAC.3